MRGLNTLRIWLVGVLTTAALAALLGSCGSSDSSKPVSATPLTKKAFVKRGNAICDAVLAERDERAKQVFLENIAEYEHLPKAGQVRLQAKAALENDLPMYKKLVLELRELPPPTKDKTTVDRFLSNYEKLLNRLFKHPAKLQAAQPFAPNAEAAAYGLISCDL